MGNLSSFDVSASGIFAQRTRLDVISNNIANADTTRTPGGGPYRRQMVTFQAAYSNALNATAAPQGVQLGQVTEDPTEFPVVYDPGHPDADANGYVRRPNVNVVEEMADMMSATRAYEANITALNAAKSMIGSAIDLGKG